MTRHDLTVTFARSRGGRAVLHAICLARGRNVRWHLGGIVRELFRPSPRRHATAADLTSGQNRARPGACRAIAIGFVAAWGLARVVGGATVNFDAPAASVAGGARPALACHLLALAQVDGTGVFLQQVATVSGLEPTVTAVPVRLVNPPAFGRILTLTREQVGAALAAARPDFGPARWTGADAVRITRRSRALAESDLRELLAAALQKEVVKDRGELELRLARPWTSIAVPDEPLALKILDLPASGVSPHFIVRFELAAGEEHLGPWQAVAQAQVMRNVLVAAAPMRRGQTLGSADVAVERKDVLALREPLDASALEGGAMEVLDPVPVGQPILGRSVRPRPVVQRGMVVDGVVRDGLLEIVLKVEVLADGLPGQQVRVRNPRSKREFYGKVKDEQTILINL